MKRLRRLLQRIVFLFFGSTILSVLVLKWCPVYITPLMVIRCAQQVKRGEHIRLRHHWVPLEEISPSMAVAVISSEDQRFLEHHGFDFDQIGKAIKERQRGKRQRGASTISQQTAKNVFLWPGGGWFRKGLEVYFTGLIEMVWGKRRIMEIYLNSIEMGDGIYGAEAVAQLHFGYPAIELTKANCALIAATLPNPIRYSSKTPSSYMYRRQTWVLNQMRYIERNMDLSVLDKKNDE